MRKHLVDLLAHNRHNKCQLLLHVFPQLFYVLSRYKMSNKQHNSRYVMTLAGNLKQLRWHFQKGWIIQVTLS